jgi:outer membrane receptor protein involved in Fe transport
MGLTFSVNVLNLFDQDAAIDYYARELFDGQAIEISSDDFFRGFDTQELIEEQGLFRDPRFLMDTDFQPPRQIRLGARLSF